MDLPAARHWRLVFSTSGNTSAGSVAVATLAWRAADGTLLSTGGVASSTPTGTYEWVDTANAFDTDLGTVAYLSLSTGTVIDTVNDGTALAYDFTPDGGEVVTVLPDHFELHLKSGVWGSYNAYAASLISLWVQYSTNGSTWVNAMHYPAPGALLSLDATYKFGLAKTSQYFPRPYGQSYIGAGGIYGIVTEDGEIKANYPVFLYERDTFNQIGRAYSNEYGGYAFEGLDENRQYLVLAVDPTGPNERNALVYDRIQPIHALSLQESPRHAFWLHRKLNPLLRGMVVPGDHPDDWAEMTGPMVVETVSSGKLYNAGVTGSGYNPTSLPMPDGLTDINALFPKTKWWSYISGKTTTGDDWTVEAAIVPPLADNGYASTLIFYGPNANGYTNIDYTASDYYNRRYSIALEVYASGTIDVWFFHGTAPTRHHTVANALPINQVSHIALTFSRNVSTKLWVNGVEVSSVAIPSTGTLKQSGSGDSGNQYANISASRLSATTSSNNIWYGDLSGVNGVALSYKGSLRSSGWLSGQCDLGFIFAAWYDSDLSATSGALEALYDTFANNPDPGLLPYVGYAGLVAKDAPRLWQRLQEVVKPAYALGAASPPQDSGGLYDDTNITYAQPGMTNGCTSVQFNGGLFRGLVEQNSPLGATYGGRFTFSRAHSHELWVKPVSLAATGQLFGFSDGSLRAYLTLSSAGYLEYKYYTSTGSTYAATFSHTPLSVGSAYHIVVTCDPIVDQETRLYINGVLVNTQPCLDLITLNLMRLFTLGGYSTYGSGSVSGPVNAYLQDFAHYSYALTADQIAAHYAARDL